MATDLKLIMSRSKELPWSPKESANSPHTSFAPISHYSPAQGFTHELFQRLILCRALEAPESFAVYMVESVANRSAFRCPVTGFSVATHIDEYPTS
jgi:hypothetical protein